MTDDELIAGEVNALLSKLVTDYNEIPDVDSKLDVTAEMYAAVLHITRKSALTRLVSLEQKGQLVSHKARNERGYVVYAYRKV